MKMKYIAFKKISLLLVALVIVISSCSEDFLEPTVTDSKDVNTSITNVTDLKALVTGALAKMSTTEYYRRNYIITSEVRSNNAFANGNTSRFLEETYFSYNAFSSTSELLWNQIYSVIANTNIVINSEVQNNESAAVNHVKGQAYALRALAYMDLLRVYGQQYSGGDLGVPLILEFLNDGNNFPARATVQETWSQIGQDLQTAQELMDVDLNATSKTEVTTWMVDALQSRYFLYIRDYENSAAAAKRVMDSEVFSILDASSFVSSWSSDGGSNRIFEIAITTTDAELFENIYNVYQDFSVTGFGDIALTIDLLNLYELQDVRRQLFSFTPIAINMTGKYPSSDFADDIIVIRYAEVVLNYAEAMAWLGNEEEALTALNSISENRNAQTFTVASVANILAERRRELAMEGSGFFDLVRNDIGVTTFLVDVPFGSPLLALPIPRQEIESNPQIIQNEGY